MQFDKLHKISKPFFWRKKKFVVCLICPETGKDKYVFATALDKLFLTKHKLVFFHTPQKKYVVGKVQKKNPVNR